MTTLLLFPYFLPDDRVVATRAFKWGCQTIKKGKRGVVRMTIITPDGVSYRVRWGLCNSTDVLNPTYLRLTRRGPMHVVQG